MMADEIKVNGDEVKIRFFQDRGKALFFAAIPLFYYITSCFLISSSSVVDVNVIRFFLLALFNIVLFIGLWLFHKGFRQDVSGFFRNSIGIVFFALMLLSLLSFVRAINLPEAMIAWSKAFTGFVSALLFYVIIRQDHKVIGYLAVGFSAILFFDALNAFPLCYRYYIGELRQLNQIQFVYANKNIYSTAMLVKVPFAVYLIIYKQMRYKIFGVITLICALLAILFISARTSFLALLVMFILSILLFLYSTEKGVVFRIKYVVIILFSVVSSVGFYTVLQKGRISPKEKKVRTVSSISDRFNSMTKNSSGRTAIWERSLEMIHERPFLGVGMGNWKVVMLRDLNKSSPYYSYVYKVHNDFIEITAETGVFGGSLYLYLYLIIFFNFLRRFLLQKNLFSKSLSFLWLAMMGMLFYFFDAFFNFPHDRPEIYMFFSLYIAIAIYGRELEGGERLENGGTQNSHKKNGRDISKRIALLGVFLLIMLPILSILYRNYISGRLQKESYDILRLKEEKEDIQTVVDLFPDVPNLAVHMEPIAVIKARLLLLENRYDEALLILKPDNSSPYDSRRERVLSEIYYRKGIFDTAFIFAQEAFDIKPHSEANLVSLVNALEALQERNKASNLIMDQLYKRPSHVSASLWCFAIEFFINAGEDFIDILKMAQRYYPNNKRLLQWQAEYGINK